MIDLEHKIIGLAYPGTLLFLGTLGTVATPFNFYHEHYGFATCSAVGGAGLLYRGVQELRLYLRKRSEKC